MQTEDLGSAPATFDNPVGLAEDADNMTPLGLFQRGGLGCPDHSCLPLGDRQQLAPDFEHWVIGQYDGTFENVLQFADIPGPSVIAQASHGFLADSLDAFADAHGELVDQEMDEQRDVLLAIPQRRQMDGEDVETIVQVLAERLLADRLEQVAVGGRDDADIDLDRLLAADALELALLEDAEQLGLRVGRQLADLVEEDGAAVGQLEAADAPGDGAGEGAFLVAEQLALDQAGRAGRRS